MATSISRGATTLTPATVDGYKSTQKSGAILHPINNRANGSPDVTFNPNGLRTGTLSMVFDTQAQAMAMAALHTAGGVLTLTDSDIPLAAMTYVWVDNLNVILDDATRDFWRVEVDYQEVIP